LTLKAGKFAGFFISGTSIALLLLKKTQNGEVITSGPEALHQTMTIQAPFWCNGTLLPLKGAVYFAKINICIAISLHSARLNVNKRRRFARFYHHRTTNTTLTSGISAASGTKIKELEMQLRKLAAAMLIMGMSAGIAQAEDAKTAAAPAAGAQQSTLDKIKANGVIVVGHRESSVPFSYYDNQQKVVGYSQDYSNAIVEAVKKQLNKPDLQVKLIPITSQNRIPLLQNGTFDFECGSTTNNLERQKQAAFSDTIFVVGTRLLVKKGGPIKDFPDLKGKAVVVTSGTTSEVLLNKLNEEKKMDMRIISAKDHGDSFRTLESGRAVAFMMDDALLAGERAKAKKQDNWEIVGTPQSREAYGCMLRKDDPDFKKLMDDTIAKVQTSGEAAKWFDKWFMNPIPPKNINMNFALSDDMKALFKEPNDKALN